MCDISAPTQSALQKWFREVHNIHFHICYLEGQLYEWNIDVYKLPHNGLFNSPFELQANTYEEVLELGLFEALKLLPNK